jgi:hypothetical protein
MATQDIYHGDHTVEAKGGTLTLKGDTVSITGSLSFSDATLADLTVTDTLTTSTIESNGAALSITGSSDGIALSTTTANISLTTTSTGDISLVSGDKVIITSINNMIITASGNLKITGSDYIYVIGPDNQYMLINSNGLYLTAAANSGSDFHLLPDTEVKVLATNDDVSGYTQTFTVQNEYSDAQADGMAVILEPSTLSTTNVFVRFSKDGDITNTAGRIRGPAAADSYAFVADAGTTSVPEVDSTGDVVYASGGSDFGEWIEVGDIEEWNLSEDHLSQISAENPSLRLPEGWMCYVREQKFFKEGPGTPMIVTRSALLVGNETGKEGFVGETFSFSGQISVIVKGVVNSGDLLIPSGSFYCTAISPKNVTFEQYKRVVGTAWTNFTTGEDFGRVTAAIGIKNTY